MISSCDLLALTPGTQSTYRWGTNCSTPTKLSFHTGSATSSLSHFLFKWILTYPGSSPSTSLWRAPAWHYLYELWWLFSTHNHNTLKLICIFHVFQCLGKINIFIWQSGKRVLSIPHVQKHLQFPVDYISNGRSTAHLEPHTTYQAPQSQWHSTERIQDSQTQDRDPRSGLGVQYRPCKSGLQRTLLLSDLFLFRSCKLFFFS